MDVRKTAAGKFVIGVFVVFAVTMCVCLIVFPIVTSSATWQHVLRESAVASSKVVGVFVVISVLQWIFAKLSATRKNRR